ncbi:MAG: M28 family peptidase [Bacteroidia bacterium]|nr:M28 family peptidase [Bacteroidia bacterium]
MKILSRLLAVLAVYAQDSLSTIRILQKDVARLCALRGRGHADIGSEQAVRYIQKRFQSIGCELRVDTFPLNVYRIRRARLWISPDGRKWRRLRLGKDFIPLGTSPAIEGLWEIDTIPQRGRGWLSNKALRTAYAEAVQAKVAFLMMRDKKLTASVSTHPDRLPVFCVMDTLPLFRYVRVSLHGEMYQTVGWNVSARLQGRQSDSAWVVGAHYDHLGRVEGVTFWGANDNASGVAVLLSLAARLKASQQSLPYDVWFVAFGAEELGLIGSQFWVEHPPYPLGRLRGMLNFDLMGFGEKGVAAVGALDSPLFWAKVDEVRQALSLDIPLLLRPTAPNSDHYPFHEKGVPAIFFYLQGGPGFYHDINDKPETLTWRAAYPFLRWMEALLRQP